ncbi:hypothetical protein QA639_21835 [Bradyrhizobium pachyrhizi]|uniref:hypothetical protein n=1 Tax=Bradyrhizobium pachyrhizi TaxID=280333 RepID=UPI0024B2211B|nr:hypothetical protein [Bradyrhizobium pachyrhizi]WFU52351.1 hypothetical protein QA639_21835 [Bradyrhizobium pachyrhizi]
MKLGDWPLPYVRVKCSKCDREGRLGKDGLIERFGPDREMFVVREKLTEPSCKRPDKKQPCQSVLPDGLLVQAITAKNDDEIIDKRLTAEAKTWREEKK